jgi:hypothetical protein
LWADTDATATPPAIITYDSTTVLQEDGIYEAYVLNASAAAHAPLGHSNCHTWHPADFGADPGRNVR